MSDQTLDPGNVDAPPAPSPVDAGSYTATPDMIGPPEPLGPPAPAPSGDYVSTADMVGPSEQFGPPAPTSPSSGTMDGFGGGYTAVFNPPEHYQVNENAEPSGYSATSPEVGSSAAPNVMATTQKPADPLGDAITAAGTPATGTSVTGGGGGGGGGMPSIPSPVVSTSSGGSGGGNIAGILLVTIGGGILATYLYTKYAKKAPKKETE